MSDTLQSRHAIVTGGSRGIGLAIAAELLAHGASVTILGRRQASLQQAAAKLQARGPLTHYSVDIADPEAVQHAFDQARNFFGPIDILINNAGQASSQRFDEITDAEWGQMIAVNLTGTFHCMQAALPDMIGRGWGRIVNIASTAGLIGYPQVSAYCAAKHGVIGLTRAVALEVASQGVTVNAVCPGYTETDIVEQAIANLRTKTGVSADDARARLARRNPQKRLVQPAEVATAVAWLCSPGAAAIHGQSIPVDGGEVMTG